MPAEQEPLLTQPPQAVRSIMFTDPIRVDWSHYPEHGETRTTRHYGDRNIPTIWAQEACTDQDAYLFNPDYNSISGKSMRLIGFSQSADALITVIIANDFDHLYAVTAWQSNPRDTRTYLKEKDDE